METSGNIPPKLFFRIGEVCDLIKVQPHVLRYWETEFPMLSPQKNRAGQRVYRRKDVEMVMRIRNLLYDEKFTIAGARKKISEELRKGGAPRVKVTRDKAPDFDQEEIDSELEAHAPETIAAEVKRDEPADAHPAGTQEQKTQPVSHPHSQANLSTTAEPVATARTRRTIRYLEHGLNELLTLLKSDASIKNSS